VNARAIPFEDDGAEHDITIVLGAAPQVGTPVTLPSIGEYRDAPA
jgi:hypothetical protein